MLGLVSLFQIVLVNVILSGDNALVIAMAARHLEGRERRLAMAWGGALAIAMRLLLMLVVAYIMMIPGVRFIGAVLLLVIACKLVQDEQQTQVEGGPPAVTLRSAILRIAVADLVMSLDNVLAIAGISGSNPFLLAVGLVISVLMSRFRWIIYAGTAVLAVAASGMILHDVEALQHLAASFQMTFTIPAWMTWGLRLAAVAVCLTAGHWRPRRIPALVAS